MGSYFTMLKEEYSRQSSVFSFLNSALVMCDLGLPVDFNHSCISFTVRRGPCSCPWTVPASVFWTHPTRPSFFPSAWKMKHCEIRSWRSLLMENMAVMGHWEGSFSKRCFTGWALNTVKSYTSKHCTRPIHEHTAHVYVTVKLTWVYFRKNTPCTLPKIS